MWQWHGFSIIALATSLVLGAILGAEREYRQQDAGLRTVTLVTVGACAFTLIGTTLVDFPYPETIVRLDPSRIPAYIIVGIGFLGSGPIVTGKGEVRGLTTAAGIWSSASVGMACGLGLLGFAVVLVALILLTMQVMRPLSDWFERRGTWHRLCLHCPTDDLREHALLSALRPIPHRIHTRQEDDDGILFRIDVLTSHRHAHGVFHRIIDLGFVQARHGDRAGPPVDPA